MGHLSFEIGNSCPDVLSGCIRPSHKSEMVQRCELILTLCLDLSHQPFTIYPSYVITLCTSSGKAEEAFWHSIRLSGLPCISSLPPRTLSICCYNCPLYFSESQSRSMTLQGLLSGLVGPPSPQNLLLQKLLGGAGALRAADAVWPWLHFANNAIGDKPGRWVS